MGPENIEEFEAAMAGTQALEDWISSEAPSAFAVTAEDVIASFGQLLPDLDKAALTGELAECTAESLRHAGQQGIAGWRDDDLTLIRPWASTSPRSRSRSRYGSAAGTRWCPTHTGLG
jgi:hypothetical protein